MAHIESQTEQIRDCIERLRNGDVEARGELLSLASCRLMRLTRAIKRDYQRLGRWEQTEDVFQNVSIRLHEAMKNIEIVDVRHFYRLAAKHIRHELIDLTRHHFGPQRPAKYHVTPQPEKQTRDSPAVIDPLEDTHDPERLAEWAEFHESVERLPEEERDVFDLLWYHDLKQDEAAELLNVTVKTIKRRWRSAKLRLHQKVRSR